MHCIPWLPKSTLLSKLNDWMIQGNYYDSLSLSFLLTVIPWFLLFVPQRYLCFCVPSLYRKVLKRSVKVLLGAKCSSIDHSCQFVVLKKNALLSVCIFWTCNMSRSIFEQNAFTMLSHSVLGSWQKYGLLTEMVVWVCIKYWCVFECERTPVCWSVPDVLFVCFWSELVCACKLTFICLVLSSPWRCVYECSVSLTHTHSHTRSQCSAAAVLMINVKEFDS